MKIALIGILFVLTLVYFSNPAVFSFDPSFITAKPRTPGVYTEILLAANDTAYYRINCSADHLLTVSINFSASVNLDLYLYDIAPMSDQIDASETTGTSDTVEAHISRSGEYYIKVVRILGTGNVTYTLTITLQQEFQIPAFELTYILYSILLIAGVILSKKKLKFC